MNKANPVIGLTSSGTSPTTLTVTISGIVPGTFPTGTVTITEGVATTATLSLTGSGSISSGSQSVTLTSGPHTLTASYALGHARGTVTVDGISHVFSIIAVARW